MSDKLSILLFAFAFFYGCSSPKKLATKPQGRSISELRFLSEYDLPNAKQFRGTTIGGLSAIDYDLKRNLYYLVSDDRSIINPARFYTAKIQLAGDETRGYRIDSVEFLAVDSLRTKQRTLYPNSKQDPFHAPDPEALRYDVVTDEIVWSSEGERFVRKGNSVLVDPAITIMDRTGHYKDTFALPQNMHMRESQNGPRQNSAFEGISFTDDYKHLFVSVEEPIYEDGPRAGLNDSTAWIRIIKFDAQTRKPIAQYAYRIEPIAYPAIPQNAFKLNGVSDILWIAENRLLVVERSFSTGKLACTIRVFIADLQGATDIGDKGSFNVQSAKPISKKLLLNMDDLDRYIDNIEGVTLGPNLSNGHRTLIFIVDDNFSSLQKAQFLLFEVIP